MVLQAPNLWPQLVSPTNVIPLPMESFTDDAQVLLVRPWQNGSNHVITEITLTHFVITDFGYKSVVTHEFSVLSFVSISLGDVCVCDVLQLSYCTLSDSL